MFKCTPVKHWHHSLCAGSHCMAGDAAEREFQLWSPGFHPAVYFFPVFCFPAGMASFGDNAGGK